MTPLEISTAAMSANSGSLIIVCAVASAVILIVSFLHERLKAFNAKHSIITYSDTLVRPVSWNGGRDGVDADGVPFYGSFEDEDSDAKVDNAVSIHDVVETQELTLHNELKRKSIFLRDYTTELYASGATTIRIEKNLGRIAEQWHTKADFSVLPTCIVLNLWDENEEKSYTVTGKIPADRINFNTVSDLSSLSWKVVEEDLDVCKATARFRDVLEKKRLNPWLVLVLVGLANASFCELFGGDLISMLIVFIATIDGFFLKQKLPAKGVDFRIVIVLAACLSAVIACSGFVFGWGKTPEIALATSVLYFVPGIPFCNAVCDLIYGHYICCISRFLHAVIITVCLSLGLCIAFGLLNIQFL